MSNENDFVGYVFKCRGRYHTIADADGKKKALMFEAKVAVPKANLGIFDETTTRYSGTDESGNPIIKTNRFVNYLGVLKKKLLPLKLKAQLPDFLSVKTNEVEEVVGVGCDVSELALPITMLSLEQIRQYCAFHGISRADIDPSSYITLADLRTDLYDYMADKDSFRARKEKSQKRRADESAFRAANDIDADAILAREPQEFRGKKKAKPQSPDTASGAEELI